MPDLDPWGHSGAWKHFCSPGVVKPCGVTTAPQQQRHRLLPQTRVSTGNDPCGTGARAPGWPRWEPGSSERMRLRRVSPALAALLMEQKSKCGLCREDKLILT